MNSEIDLDNVHASVAQIERWTEELTGLLFTLVFCVLILFFFQMVKAIQMFIDFCSEKQSEDEDRKRQRESWKKARRERRLLINYEGSRKYPKVRKSSQSKSMSFSKSSNAMAVKMPQPSSITIKNARGILTIPKPMLYYRAPMSTSSTQGHSDHNLMSDKQHQPQSKKSDAVVTNAATTMKTLGAPSPLLTPQTLVIEETAKEHSPTEVKDDNTTLQVREQKLKALDDAKLLKGIGDINL